MSRAFGKEEASAQRAGAPSSETRDLRPETQAKMRVEAATHVFENGPVVAFQNLDLEIRDGETLCIVGPSGCGKTTLLRCLAGLLRPSEGHVLLDGRVVTQPDHSVVMVFQHFGLFPWKTVWENATYGLKLRGIPRTEWDGRVRPYIELTGLAGFEHVYPYQLSGGMQQRTGLVRALSMNPSVLLMDEPFGALDAQTRELLQEELARILERELKTMVFITHSIDEAIVLGDRIAVMSARPGQVRELIEVGMPRPRDLQAVRGTERYQELRTHIWEELRPQAAAAVR